MGLFDAFGVGGGELAMQVQFPQVQAGGVLQGVVTFTAGRRAQQITNIKVTLNCTTQQFAPGQPQAQQRTEAVAPATVLSGPFTTQPGGAYQFPFQIQVPPAAWSSQPNAVSYRLGASADIDGEIDPGAGQDIQVIGTPFAQHGPVGMTPMGGPQGNWDQGQPGYGKGGYVDPNDKAAYAKGGYDKGGYVDPNAKAAYAKGGHDKGGYVDPNAKAAYAKGGGGWAPGTRARAQWSDGGWYGVSVVGQQGDAVLVQWDDGTPASWVRLDQIGN